MCATTGVSEIVEAMHCRIASGAGILGKPLALPARIVTSLAYGNVRFVTWWIGELGDWLRQTQSPLALDLRLRKEGAGPKAVVLVHGSSMNDRQWLLGGHDHGRALARDDGWVPVYVLYNSGLSIAENGRLLAERLEELADAEEIAILGHSWGGLVARSACHVAETEGLAWRRRLRSLVTLGTPHRGAPLERYGRFLEALLPISSYSAPLARLGRIRSAGITDMRYGLDLPLPAGVRCHAIAAGKDRLVPVSSAHGAFPRARCTVVPDTTHLDLLSSAEAYQAIRHALSR